MDVSKLSSAELASHLGNPHGEIGLAVGEFMSAANRQLSDNVYRRLDVQPGGHMLEVGVGNGDFIPLLLNLAPDTRYTGVDISETMLAAATKANEQLVNDHRVTLHLASVEKMPLDATSVDRAVTVNCIYFWPDPVKGLTEIRRVLKPGGFLIVAALTPASAERLPFANLEHGFRIYEAAPLEEMHIAAGFSSVTTADYSETLKRPDGTPIQRQYHIVRAVA